MCLILSFDDDDYSHRSEFICNILIMSYALKNCCSLVAKIQTEDVKQ